MIKENKKSPRDIQQYEVCLDKEGNMTQHYWDKPDPKTGRSVWGHYDLIYTPNYIFKDTLVFEKCFATKGSAHFIFRSTNSNHVFSFFLSDFELMLKANKLQEGNILQGEFTFCKRGSSQGLRMILE